MSIAIFFTIASTGLPWIAYYVANWRLTSIIISVPLIFAIASPFIVPESARWLVSQGRVEEAIHILHKFERINKTKVPDKVYQDFRVNFSFIFLKFTVLLIRQKNIIQIFLMDLKIKIKLLILINSRRRCLANL